MSNIVVSLHGTLGTSAGKIFDPGSLSEMIAHEMEIGGESRVIVRDRILSRAMKEFPGDHTHHTVSSGMTYVLGKLSEHGYIVDSYWKVTE